MSWFCIAFCALAGVTPLPACTPCLLLWPSLVKQATKWLSDIYKHLHLKGDFEVSSYSSLNDLLIALVAHVGLDLDVNQVPSYKPEYLEKYAWPGTSLGGGRVRYLGLLQAHADVLDARWRLCLLFCWNSSRH